MKFERALSKIIKNRLGDYPRFMTIVAGPRQIGKSTLVRQVLRGRSALYCSADQPLPYGPSTRLAGMPPVTSALGAAPTAEWLIQQWARAREAARKLADGEYFVLAVDEVQKVPRWSEVVKGMWDADRAEGIPLHVVLLGSSPWLMNKGLSESLLGRYELVRMSHWSFREMQEAFDFSLEEYIYFGGYPGSAPLIRDEQRWRDYVRVSLINPNIETDILQMTRVDKPALLKALFELGCGAYSGQIIALGKLQGQLQDAGNTVTLSHYLDLLDQAGLLVGLQKYAGQVHRQRASPPKLNARNTALISALAGYSFEEARADRSYWGRLVESAVGAHLVNTAGEDCRIHYWRESPHEVDFVLTGKRGLVAVEVKSGERYAAPVGLGSFCSKFTGARPVIVGAGGIPLVEFLSHPAAYWLEPPR